MESGVEAEAEAAGMDGGIERGMDQEIEGKMQRCRKGEMEGGRNR